jgi:hypothetical protein
MPETGTTWLGFHLVAELGRGAFGRVFLAHQGDLANRPVALKVATDLIGESQTLAQLQHTNIVPIYSVHRCGPFQAVCMPYFGSATLADVVKHLASSASLPVSGKALVATVQDRKSRTRLDEPSSPGTDAGEPPLVLPVGATPDAAPAALGNLTQLENLNYVEAVLWVAARG